MQVDPIGMASVSLGNPQTLNLYAYTANDPVNYVDPLGLVTHPDHPSAFIDPTKPAGLNWLSDWIRWGGTLTFFLHESTDSKTEEFTRSVIGVWYFGGPPRGPEPQQQPQERRVQPSCDQFVDALVKIVTDALGTLKKALEFGASEGNPTGIVKESVGTNMVSRAVDNVDPQGRGYLKGPAMPQGFRQDLINNGQGGDVYHHIEFVAGNKFLGASGKLAIEAFILYDRKQARDGRRESETELRDDEAGIRVGNAMLSSFSSGNTQGLKDSLRGALCQ